MVKNCIFYFSVFFCVVNLCQVALGENQNEIKSLLPFYKAEHIYDAPSLEEGCINPNKDWNKVEEEYIKSPKQRKALLRAFLYLGV